MSKATQYSTFVRIVSSSESDYLIVLLVELTYLISVIHVQGGLFPDPD